MITNPGLQTPTEDCIPNVSVSGWDQTKTCIVEGLVTLTYNSNERVEWAEKLVCEDRISERSMGSNNSDGPPCPKRVGARTFHCVG
jgi:hypothetical protein